jgi:hypothetical protein
MAVEFQPQSEEHREAVVRFNRRLEAALGRAPFLLPTEPRSRAGLIETRHWLAVEGTEVRGGYLLASFPCRLNGAEALAANIQSPLAESIAEKRYVHLPALMVRQFVRHNPLCFCVGMGEASNPLPRLLRAAGWSVEAVPFLFRVHRAARFLRLLPALRASWWRRAAAWAAARTGAGALGGAWLHRRRERAPAGSSVTVESGWGSWADEVWQAFEGEFRFAVRRDAAMLGELYSPLETRLRIYRIRTRAETVGWAAALLTPMRGHAYFGDLCVATILDCAATPEGFFTVAALADEALGAEGADVVITNQALPRWRRAFREAGFWPGPSNYQLACSPRLVAALSPNPVASGLVHITRGDGDGRIHL